MQELHEQEFARMQKREEFQARQLEQTRAMRDELAQRLGMTTATPRMTYAEIERRACKLFKCTKSDIRSNRRHRDIVFVRQFIAYWACRRTNLSLPMIGRLMGGRDHTTCLHHKRVYPTRRAAMGRFLRQVR